MRIVMWILRLVLFFFLFGFAVKNDQLVSLKFFFGAEWHLPLVFVILVTFTGGALLGITAVFASLLRQRRECSRLRRQLARMERDRPTAVVPVAPDVQAPETF